MYVFQTPHLFVGPSDISQYFCDEPEGFHLKEWTYSEIVDLVRDVGYSSCRGYWKVKGTLIRLPLRYFYFAERMIRNFSPARRRKLSRYILNNLILVATK